LEDLPDEVRAAMEFVFVDTVDQVLEAALSPAPKKKTKRKKEKKVNLKQLKNLRKDQAEKTEQAS
jgi:hypothetical protein